MKNLPEFGISLYSAEQLDSCAKLKNFGVIELPGILLDSPLDTRALKAKNLMVRELCPHRVLDVLPEANLGVKLDFFRLFSSRCAVMKKIGAVRGSLLLDYERLTASADLRHRMTEILHCCGGIAEKYQIRLVFELRVPGAFAARGREFIRFCRELLLPCNTLIDFHPHEPGGFNMLEKLPADLDLDRWLWRISFDASSGNHLTAESLRRILTAVKKGCWETPCVIFAPGEHCDADTFSELSADLDNIAEIV